MNIEIYLGFIIATAILAAIPGPVVTLLVITGTTRGKHPALLTLAGSTSALVLHVSIVALGMSSLLSLVGEWFTWLKWMGALYLIWLGLLAWRESIHTSAVSDPIQPGQGTFIRGFLVGVTNPKTLLFYAAFFPQFIDATQPLGPQLALLCPTFVIVGGLIDFCYAISAASAGKWLVSVKAKQITNALSGSILIAVGAALATSKRI